MALQNPHVFKFKLIIIKVVRRSCDNRYKIKNLELAVFCMSNETREFDCHFHQSFCVGVQREPFFDVYEQIKYDPAYVKNIVEAVYINTSPKHSNSNI